MENTAEEVLLYLRILWTRQDKTRLDIYYRNITSKIVWHAVSKKTQVEACQINSITNQILYYNK